MNNDCVGLLPLNVFRMTCFDDIGDATGDCKKGPKLRVLAAFIIAPICPALLALAHSLIFDEIVFYEFILGMGAIIGYGFALVIGVPAYFFYFKDLNPVRVMPFIWFGFAVSALFLVLFGAMFAGNMSWLEVLGNPTFWVYSLIISLSAAVAIFAFYILAFHEFSNR